jgi:threonine/homoserine/homoserine lactone efflux protein
VDFLSLVTTVASAFIVTFATVVIPSPSTVAASRYAMSRGTHAGAVFLGAVLCLDTAVFLVLALGFHPVLHAVGVARYLAPVAGAGLVVVGVVMAATARRGGPRGRSSVAAAETEEGGTPRGPFLAGLLVPASNPGFWIWWTTVGTSFIHAARHWGNIGLGLLLLAFIGGAAAWYLPLLWALSRGRQVFSQRVQEITVFCLGVAMIGFGAVLLWRSLVALG